MQATNKFKGNLGTQVINYFKLKKEEEEEISKKNNADKKALKIIKEKIVNCYSNLKLVIHKTIIKEINRLGLNKVVTNHQIELTKSDLLKEIVIPPKNYENFIKDTLADESHTVKEQERLIRQANISKHVSSTIRSISELEDTPAPFIQSYLLKRTFTLLKQNAEEKSKEYILLNNKIKKAINTLKTTNLISEPIKGHFTVSNKPTAIFNPKLSTINTNDELEEELKRNKHNLQNYILAFLRANYVYSFAVRDITTFAASMFLQEKEIEQRVKIYKNNTESIKFEIDSKSPDDPIAKVMADDAINTLKSRATTDKAYVQSEIALLAYLYRIVPKYFSNTILSEEQIKEEETNCIKNFLNDKRFNDFNKSEIERTTANNRKKAGLRLLKSHFIDLTVVAQEIFIKSCCEYLEEKYINTLGVKR